MPMFRRLSKKKTVRRLARLEEWKRGKGSFQYFQLH